MMFLHKQTGSKTEMDRMHWMFVLVIEASKYSFFNCDASLVLKTILRRQLVPDIATVDDIIDLWSRFI